MLQFEELKENSNYIKVIGVGGGGTNAINHMYNEGIKGVDFIVCNTDKKSLDSSPVTNKIKIGKDGLGAGNNPEKAKNAALAAEDEIKSMLQNNTQMLFIAAGMGGGTGTGASPVIAKFAKEIELHNDQDEVTDDKILVVAVVTLPLAFEGARRKKQAEEGIKNLKEIVDSLIIVNTDKIRGRGNIPLPKMFPMADDVLLTATKGIAEIITSNAYVTIDFRDVQSVMEHSGVALMGTGIGYGSGEERALEAIRQAAASDLLNDCSIKGTKNVLLYITTSEEEEYAFTMDEYEAIARYLQDEIQGEPDLIWGLKYDNECKDRLEITMIATGFEEKALYKPFDRESVAKVVTLEEKPEDSMQPKPTAQTVEEEKPQESNPDTPINVIPIETQKPQEPFIKQKPQSPIAQVEQPTVNTATQEKIGASIGPLRHTLDVFPDNAPQMPKTQPQVQSAPSEISLMTDITLKEPATQTKKEESTVVANAITPIAEPAEKPTIEPSFNINSRTQEEWVRERQMRMEQFAKEMHTPSGLENLIKTPAYELYNMDIEMKTHSKERDTSAFKLYNGQMIKDDNAFLNDNPD